MIHFQAGLTNGPNQCFRSSRNRKLFEVGAPPDGNSDLDHLPNRPSATMAIALVNSSNVLRSSAPTCTTSSSLLLNLANEFSPSSIVSVSGFSRSTSFPGQHRLDQRFGVPMIRCCYVNNVDIFSFQYLAIVCIDIRFLCSLLRSRDSSFGVYVCNRDNIAICRRRFICHSPCPRHQ